MKTWLEIKFYSCWYFHRLAPVLIVQTALMPWSPPA
jgi:hypothetical protein